MMRSILEGSAVWRALSKLPEWYRMGVIAHFFQAIRDAYPNSRFRKLWQAFCAAVLPTQSNSAYARAAANCRRRIERWGPFILESLVYRLCIRIWQPFSSAA